jgi:hypothetical protein
MVKHAIAVGLLFGFLSVIAPATSNGQDRVTLYSSNKHPGERKVFCMNFRLGPMGYTPKPCDLRYGSLYVGDDMDWFQSSGALGHRSVIKDLGLLNWDQAFTVSVVQPLPKLKPGEQRQVTIDASGADGADGAPGADGLDGIDGDGVLRPKKRTSADLKTPEKPKRPKHDGKPRIDPMFVNAIVGHMYVIHVVNDIDDFYVVFRVEEIERGSRCTVSWRFIQDPALSVAQTKN